MQIYLIRHAHALDGADDAARPLSGKGRRQIQALADFLGRNKLIKVRQFWHSPLVRSRDTAARLAKRLASHGRLVEMAGLLSDDDPALMGRRLGKVGFSVAVVGHEPHLGALASLLVTGKTQPPHFVLKKGTVLALERTPDGWAVAWQVSPALL